MSFFRRKAAEAREHARLAPTAQLRSRYLAVAESYERLANAFPNGAPRHDKE